MSDAFLALDREGTLLFANSSALALHGSEYVDVVGREYWHEFPLADSAGLRKLVDAAFESGESQHSEIDSCDGERIFDAHAHPSFGTVHVYLRDVTERVQAQREAQFEAERQALLVAFSNAVVGISDPRELLRRALTAVGTHLGVARCSYAYAMVAEDRLVVQDEYVDGVPTIVGEFTLSSFGKEVVTALSEGVPVAIDNIDDDPVTSPNRDIFAALQVRSGLTIPLVRNGELVALFGANHSSPRSWTTADIEGMAEIASRLWNAIEWARDIERLIRSEARFRAAVSAVGVLWTNDAQGRMTGEQPGWQSLTGQTPEEYHGFGWANALHPEDAEPTVAAWQEAVRERRMFAIRHRVRGVDGEYRRFSVRGVPVFDERGDIQEWVGVHRALEG